MIWLPVWMELETAPYYLTGPFNPSVAIGTVLGISLVAAMLLGMHYGARQSSRPWLVQLCSLTFLVLLAVPLNAIRRILEIPGWSGLIEKLGSPLTLVLSGVMVLIAASIARKYPRLTDRVGIHAAILCSPVLLVTLPQVVMLAWSVPSAEASSARPAPSSQGPQSRVVWMLFDELDQRLAFDDPSMAATVPELRKLASQSFVASAAHPPGASTIHSVPGMINGQIVTSARVSDRSLWIRYAGASTAVEWGQTDNVFRATRNRGVRTEIVGWYHSYCRVFANDLDRCAWLPYRREGDLNVSVPSVIVQQLLSIVRAAPFGDRFELDEKFQPAWFGRELRAHHLANYREVFKLVSESLARPEKGLLYVHWPIPHLPAIYDNVTEEQTLTGAHTYLDNLRLADSTVSQVIRTLQESGQWEQTTLIITADHWWRRSPQVDRRVPLLIKLAGQHEAVSYNRSINTTLLKTLVPALAAGDIETTGELVAWLDSHAGPAS